VGGVKEDDMANEERVGQDAAHDADIARLPVPFSDRRPAMRPADVVPVDRADAVVRAVSGAPVLAPMVAAAVVTATAAAVVSGVAAASQWMWPWLAGRMPSAPKAPSSASSLGPGVHVSYTHIEMHWPLGR
jgi:hypothetical protein